MSGRRGCLVRLSAHLARRLEGTEGARGRVHSVFARAVNVQWGDGSLLALHGPGPLLAPFAAWDGKDFVDCPVESGRLLAPGLGLSWEGAQRVDCALAGPRPCCAGAFAAPVGALPPHAPGLDSALGRDARAALAAGIAARDGARLMAGARALLGLGEGLTPAGDDCLVGALAVLHAVDAGVLTQPGVAASIASDAAARTTTIAREFVLHALAGRFSEPVLAVLRARSRDEAGHAAAQLAAAGGTSGADTLHGMRLAWDALAA